MQAVPNTVEPGVEPGAYEPSPAYPFGRPNPAAPPELTQFAFMIGEFDCVDRLLQQDGSWQETTAIWNASYFLDGFGIQDRYWNDRFATSNIRIYDPGRGSWFVNYAMMPTATVATKQWQGEQLMTDDGPTMVMWSGSPDRQNGSLLTFSEITETGFRWSGANVQNGANTVTWTSFCTRRLPGSRGNNPHFVGSDPSSTAPFGRRHEQAPAALEALDFLVGSFEAGEEEQGTQVISHGSYFLNGWAIQLDSFRSAGSDATLLLWNPSTKKFRLLEFRMPAYRWTIWDGTWEEQTLHLQEVLPGARGTAPKAGTRSMSLSPLSAGGYRLGLADGGVEKGVDYRPRRRTM